MRNRPHYHLTTAAGLYLSGLDHESLYSNAELRHAIAETMTALDDPEQLIPFYERALRGPGATPQDMRRRRDGWALRMAADLARTASPAAPLPDPVPTGETSFPTTSEGKAS
ncbi:hypothetical protein [Streptomyces sp. NPDC052015]|uniref:hypothetical protein n=1 Tax=Streptomyces sp. NPDC052015 TaxID=3154755 RepID=UPI003446D11F